MWNIATYVLAAFAEIGGGLLSQLGTPVIGLLAEFRQGINPGVVDKKDRCVVLN